MKPPRVADRLDIRWQQRFANFDRAFLLLKEVQERGVASLSQLEKEGAIQRFEMAFELAWKTLKDYLEESGLLVQVAAPREVIKQAFQAGLLPDGQLWIDIMLHRNLLSHTYNQDTFHEVLEVIHDRYFPAFAQLHAFFQERMHPQ